MVCHVVLSVGLDSLRHLFGRSLPDRNVLDERDQRVLALPRSRGYSVQGIGGGASIRVANMQGFLDRLLRACSVRRR